ncbi:MAG: hypothetical protein WC841_01520 [Candidatus Shapirobacteria bacterium]|jgi:hypothetical protein
MKKWLVVVIFLLITVIEFIVAREISYPPGEEQLKILNIFNIGGDLSLWGLRFGTFLVSCGYLWIWYKLASKYISKNVVLWSCIFVLISPTFFALWLIHPLIVAKLFVIIGSLYVFFVYLKNVRFVAIGLGLIVLVLGANLILFNNRPTILSKLSLGGAQDEVTIRISSEDTLSPRIMTPLWLRRVSYNKYFFIYRNVIKEILPFFDVETLFFQEVHPMEQKSIVMFYWPEIYLCIFGIYFLMKIKNKQTTKFLIICLIISLIDYLSYSGDKGLRMVFIMLPISITLSEAVVNLDSSRIKGYGLAGFFLIAFGILTIYSFGINFYDMTVRREYWFDNRPLAYQFWFENLRAVDISLYSRIQVTTLIGNTKAYCRFYLGEKCDQPNIIFNNFNAKSDILVGNSIYAGFAGEFVGPKFNNDIDENWKEIAQNQGWSFMAHKRLRDTIANQYGNDIGLAIR